VTALLLWTLLDLFNNPKLIEYENYLSHTSAIKRMGLQHTIDALNRGETFKGEASKFNYPSTIDECKPYRLWWRFASKRQVKENHGGASGGVRSTKNA
jgi:hypothetical protein